MSKPCRFCASLAHTSFYCYQKPRKPIPRPKTKLAQRKPIKPFGKYAKQWMITRAQWFKDNPPDSMGAYHCYICQRHLFPNQVQLDHIKSRSRHPELRFVQSNLRPCCHACNEAKGSKDLEQLGLDGIV